jgi:streptogramin lyase
MSAMPSPLTPGSRRRRLRAAIVVVSLAGAVAGSVLIATATPGRPATTRGLTATLRLPGRPNFAVAGPGALWVSTFRSNANPNLTPTGQLLRVDLATGAVQQSIQLPGGENFLVRYGDRVIANPGFAGTPQSCEHPTSDCTWPGELLAFNWRTGRLLAHRRAETAAGPMTAGGGAVWVAQVAPAMLQELDPTTLAPIAPPLPLTRTRVYGIAWGAGYVWASASDDGDVLRIDPTTRTITRVHVGGFPIGIVVAGGSVWVIDNAHHSVLRLNPKTLKQIGRPVNTPSGGAFYLGATDGYVFIANETDGTITRINARTGATAGAPIRIAPTTTSNSNYAAAYAIAPAGTAIWATSQTTDTISRLQAQP